MKYSRSCDLWSKKIFRGTNSGMRALNDTVKLTEGVIMRRIKASLLSSGLIALLLVPVQGSAITLLNVPTKYQEHSLWCWDGASQAALEYYETPVTQCSIANWAWSRGDCCGAFPFYWNHTCNSGNWVYETSTSIQGILRHWGVDSNARASALSQEAFVSEIDARRPFIMRFDWTTGGAHALVGSGYDLGGQILAYVDPWPGNGFTLSSYSWVVSAPDHTWTQTLQITTTPSPATYTLAVTRDGTGSGTVTSVPAGISCGTTCSNYFTAGTQLNLTATPSTGSVFTGWSGVCSGTGTCTVNMDANKTVSATFQPDITPILMLLLND